MKAYDLKTRFTTGKYEGKTLEEVFQQDTSYIEKCLIADEDFAIGDKTIQKLFEKYPEIDLSDEAIDKNLDKLDSIEMDDDDLDFDEDVYEDDIDDELPAGKLKGLADDEDDLFADDDLAVDDDWEDDEDDF
ncbi:MAG: exodeoxyribonuclease X C-terminal domain-containing protein [Bacteroidia bacterium]